MSAVNFNSFIHSRFFRVVFISARRKSYSLNCESLFVRVVKTVYDGFILFSRIRIYLLTLIYLTLFLIFFWMKLSGLYLYKIWQDDINLWQLLLLLIFFCLMFDLHPSIFDLHYELEICCSLLIFGWSVNHFMAIVECVYVQWLRTYWSELALNCCQLSFI